MTTETQSATPSSQWAAAGEPDPHGDRYACERAALTLGNLTDDELANGAFLNYDQMKLDLVAVMTNKPGYHPPIAWMTAVKDRIRWLSRALEQAKAAAPAVSAPADCHLIEDVAIVLERRDEFGQTHKREAAALRAWSAGVGSALQRLHDLITDGEAPHWPNLPQTDLASRWYVTLCEAIEQECAEIQAPVTGDAA